MAIPITLPSLSVKEAIADPIYRAVIGIDTADDALFDSSMTEDGSFELFGNVINGREDIYKNMYNIVSKLDTTHFISNVRVNYKDGESTASLTCSALAQHYREGEGLKPDTTRYLSGGLYFIDVVKDDKDGLWKVKHWKVKIVWTEGDQGVMGRG